MSNICRNNVHEIYEINRLKTLNETNKTFKVLRLCHHEQLETTFPENRKPLNCNFDVKSYISLRMVLS